MWNIILLLSLFFVIVSQKKGFCQLPVGACLNACGCNLIDVSAREVANLDEKQSGGIMHLSLHVTTMTTPQNIKQPNTQKTHKQTNKQTSGGIMQLSQLATMTTPQNIKQKTHKKHTNKQTNKQVEV